FRPRPARPPLLIGGAPAHAFRRALRHRAGWLPIGVTAESLRAPAAQLREAAAAAGLPPPAIVVLGTLPRRDPPAASAALPEYGAAGATQVIHAERHATLTEFPRMRDALARVASA